MKSMGNGRDGAEVLDVFIDAMTWDTALSRIADWAGRRESRYVCNCNVHALIEASRDPRFKNVLGNADMVTPDGMPLAWMLRHLGFPGQQRIDGPDLMLKYCELAARRGDSIYLFGSTKETLALLSRQLLAASPALRIA